MSDEHKTILVIAPHLDDEVLGVGGTIARAVAQGCDVHVGFICSRAYNHQYNSENDAKEEQDAQAARRVLGYKSATFLRLRDERLYEQLIDVIIGIERMVESLQPQVVYIPHRGDNNQDHRTVFEASMVALRSFSAPCVREIYSYEVGSSTEQAAPFTEHAFLPNAYVNIESVLAKKQQALQCYERELRVFPNPRSVKGVDIWAARRGAEAHCRAAEAFEVIRMIK